MRETLSLKKKAPHMQEIRTRISSLLDYIVQVEAQSQKPAFTVPKEHFCRYQFELKGLPEIRFNLQQDGDDVWLRLPRLMETAAPAPEARLASVINISKDPDELPTLKAERVTVDRSGAIVRVPIAADLVLTSIFESYVEDHWRPWAAAEIPRRRAIDVYRKLYALQQSLQLGGEDAAIELVWGFGIASWKKKDFATPLQHPLILQLCDITLDEETFEIEVRPRDVDPTIALDTYTAMDLAGVVQLDGFWKSALKNGASRISPFDPSTYQPVLSAAVGYLDESGSYDAAPSEALPRPSENLVISNSWVLFARKRTNDSYVSFVRRLIDNVEASQSLPELLGSFVQSGGNEISSSGTQAFRGLSTSDSQAGAFELFFPLPYNDEQVSIIQKLETSNGVVVQGPPGTGKSHTIANVVAHYLANGKRVLVTSKGDSALSVLQEKIPEAIRPLSVALLGNEASGMKQFEHAIQTIASEISDMLPTRTQAQIVQLELRLNQLHSQIADVDQQVTAFAGNHMKKYTFGGRDVSAEEMARTALDQAASYDWFVDLPMEPENGTLNLNTAQIDRLRLARITAGDDLSYLECPLPAPDDFPQWSDLLTLHRDIVHARAIDTNITGGALWPLVDSQSETNEKLAVLATMLSERAALLRQVGRAGFHWIPAFTAKRAEVSSDDPVLAALMAICAESQGLEVQRRELLVKAIVVVDDAESNADVREAVARAVDGKKPFPVPFIKGEARKIVDSITVTGEPPVDADAWKAVQDLLSWRTAVRKLGARWNAIAAHFGLDPVRGDVATSFSQIVAAQVIIENLELLQHRYADRLPQAVGDVFGMQIAEMLRADPENVISALEKNVQEHLTRSRLQYTEQRRADLLKKLAECSGQIVIDLRSLFTDRIGRAENDEVVLQAMWVDLQAELTRLIGQRTALDTILEVTDAIAAAGAPIWAGRLRKEPAGDGADALTPSSWLEAWNWRRSVMFLEKIDGHGKMRLLFTERHDLTKELGKTYQELVAKKTWLGVHRNSTVGVRQALQAYLTAIRFIGRGTGTRAHLYRRDARNAMREAFQAVPCWVLPEWRVAETMPAELGLFDLVIIDEASQSDIWALPALMLGKKILVVGDHKQVSPSAVGLQTKTIENLRDRYLHPSQQPHGAYMTPERSIYDLAQVVFAGNSVMLKEHFRCVPAIIEFSNRTIYNGEIKPLRLPKSNERLDPPLIDVFVRGGFRKGDVNAGEALAVVNEIEAIIADDQYAGRTIGVVTLLGMEQAKHIQALVSERIPMADQIARKLAVGAPPAFQGRERDIMMISMVLDSDSQAAQNRTDQEQRFNVALSRARDRMYLFRSVDDKFSATTLNGMVIRHFKQPFTQDPQKVGELKALCESPFEHEMFDELVRRNYRIRPQVKSGQYRIDFVVEGDEGRRLAIECDGDKYHGPDQWRNDIARQRVLERAGWTFWRCFASTFVRRRAEVMDELVATLTSLGIQPLGAESVDNTQWVSKRVVDPFNVAGDDDDVEEGISAAASR